MTTELDVALRLFEALLILIPVWIAVTKYLVREGIQSKDADPALSVYYLFISYLFILGALVMLRGVLFENIQSNDLQVAIDFLVGFVFAIFSSILVVFMIKWITLDEKLPDEFIPIRRVLGLSVNAMYIVVLFLSIVMFGFWAWKGSTIIDLLYESIHILV